MAFMGMNMAGNMGGMNAQSLYQMGAQQPAPAARRTGRLELYLRPNRNYRKVLPGVRRKKTGAEECGRQLEMPVVRRNRDREILPGMRHEKARSAAGGLDVQLRCSEQGKVLRRMRQTQAGRCPAVQVRQMRLGTG